MKNSPQKKLVAILVTIILLVGLEIIFQLGYGYFAGNFMMLALILGLSVVYYVAMLIYAVIIAWSAISIQRKLLFAITWLLMVLIGLIPGGHFVTLGALYSVYKNDPVEIATDTRMLMQEYKPLTCFGFPMRDPCDNPVHPTNLPLSIQKAIPDHVLLLENAVLIEKMGLGGVFRGFVVFPIGDDIWENEPAVQLQNGCKDCWKIRIVDGFYWYHATEVHPIKSMFSAEK